MKISWIPYLPIYIVGWIFFLMWENESVLNALENHAKRPSS